MFTDVKRSSKLWTKKQNTSHRCYKSKGATDLSLGFSAIFYNLKIILWHTRQRLTPRSSWLIKNTIVNNAWRQGNLWPKPFFTWQL
jgi:hypothetical protein